MPDQKPRQRRNRTTRPSVMLAERTAKSLITIGGIGTIGAVSLIFFFLVWVVLPLFQAPRAEVAAAWEVDEVEALRTGADEYRLLAWTLRADGELVLMRLDTGAVLSTQRLPGEPPRAASFVEGYDSVVFGYEDGSLRVGRIGFDTSYLEPGDAPQVGELTEGAVVELGGGLAQMTGEGQLRLQKLVVEVDDPLDAGTGGAIDHVDHSHAPAGMLVASLDAEGNLAHFRIREVKNLLTGKVTRRLARTQIPYVPEAQPPARLLLSGLGNRVFLLWPDGRVLRFDVGDLQNPRLVEELDVIPDPEARLSAVSFMLGKTTLVVGDDRGGLRAWFPVQTEAAETNDGALFELGHVLTESGPAPTALASSGRSRLLAAGYDDGSLRLFQVTTGKAILTLETETASAVDAVAFAAKEDGLLALSGARLYDWSIDKKHPEASLSGLTSSVWYEGYTGPQHVWQSSSGTDDFEPKYGVIPLVLGTLKATLYSMLFGVPIALLAAVFTSEFLSPRLRAPVKSSIELMASLPSVVLGFLAALVLAPFVQSFLPSTLAALLVAPFAILLGAFSWQFLPPRLAIRWSGGQRFFCILMVLPLGLAGAFLFGPLLENAFFGGDFEAWLNGNDASGVWGWVFILAPLSALGVSTLMGAFLTPWLRRASADWDRAACARFDLLRFAGGVAATFALAWAFGSLLMAAGFDPRGSIMGGYVQRNALIVGFVMGFAIIPIIYTLAEDALSGVPGHLREGSLGAGATHWQTAVRIIIPTAMSGLFSAIMIGLGRAVGETMIVLMATGNTPIMDLNIFNGFRTLSANIATELPEAVRDSTHYRILFLTALILFAITFAVNTLAEVVRQRFRKRAFQL